MECVIATILMTFLNLLFDLRKINKGIMQFATSVEGRVDYFVQSHLSASWEVGAAKTLEGNIN